MSEQSDTKLHEKNDQTENTSQQENKVIVYEKWEDLDLKSELLKGLFSVGFDNPSYIQKTAIKPIISGFDVRAQAQSGTGKTGAFAVAALQILKKDTTKGRGPQVVVVVNTLEIAEQNYNRISEFGAYMTFEIALLVAGISIHETINELQAGVDIVVGTPGRINHMVRDGHLNLSNVRLFIVDEADEMLREGFSDQMYDIFSKFNLDTIKSALFSATWEDEALEMSKKLLDNPVTITLRQDELTLKGIEQYYASVGQRPHSKDEADNLKISCLAYILKTRNVGQCIVFVQSRTKAEKVYQQIKEVVEFPVNRISGELSPKERTETISSLRDGTVRVLISTPVTARGIDIQQLSVVINLDMPRKTDKASYIHRIGRAGRYGKKGKALNIVFADELSDIRDLETHYQTKILPMPDDLDL